MVTFFEIIQYICFFLIIIICIWGFYSLVRLRLKMVFVALTISFVVTLFHGCCEKAKTSMMSPDELTQYTAENQARLDERETKEKQKEREFSENEVVKEQAYEENDNPYYEYKDGTKGLVGYMLWYTIAKTPKVKNFYNMRKSTLPYSELISSAELEKLEYRNVSFVKNILSSDRYEMDDNGNILAHGHTSLEIPIISKATGELTPAGWAILAKRIPNGNIVPIYIGYLGAGTYEGYGILFETKKIDDTYITYIKYEGNFSYNKYNGIGNLYEIDTNNMENGIPKIKIYSGQFSKGAKNGDFIEYDGTEMKETHYDNDRLSYR